MVKRKRTLSVKENNENVNQTSDAEQITETKRSKTHSQPVNAERHDDGLEQSNTPQNSVMPPASQTLPTPSGSSGVPVPVTICQSFPDVPLPNPPVIPQTRPTPQLRTSARVLNKQRREETKADLANLTAAANKKADSAVKPEFLDEEDGNAGTGNNEKKRRRAWELWSMEDKDIFFESINECGKDFEAIQNSLMTKLRKKGTPGYQIKNKDQVRHFYYRTWHKISKHITFSEGVKKATQELYGLINFGELRKKTGGTLDERKGQKLQELIRKGSTSVRVKGKSIRVRTPICRALKKLNQIEEHREQGEVRVPQSITVEIVPRSVEAWCRVQGLAHNPRVRVTSPLQKPLSSLLSHLQEKWRSSDLKLRETLASRANFPLEIEAVAEPTLRLLPAKGCVIKPLNVQPDVMMKSSAVSLQSHEARLRRRGEKLSKIDKRKEAKHTSKQSVGVEDGSCKDTDDVGKSKEQTTESERSEASVEGNRCDVNSDRGDCGGKGCDIEILGGDLDDFTGEVSQEEMEDGSDVEADCLNSPDGDHDDAIVISSSTQMPLPIRVREDPHDCLSPPTSILGLPALVKEEPLDCLSPPTSILDPLDLNDQEETLDPDVRIKEEGESGDTLRQLLALETVANSQNVEDDADVVCIGESTRLTAHVGEGQKGLRSSANQSAAAAAAAACEEGGQAATPEPEEEEKDPSGEDKPSTVDTEAYIKNIRQGWILSTLGGITIGELYLMFGQNKKINLEYDFEHQDSKQNADKKDGDLANVESSKEGLDDSPIRTGVSSVSQIVAGLSTPTVSSVDLLQVGHTNFSGENEKQSNGVTVLSSSTEERAKDINENENEAVEEKRAAVENLSGMLTHLLAMARVILAKPPNDSCSCGHVCGRGGGGMRSPAAGRGQGLFGVNRSPGNTRSPRNCRVTAVGCQSPGAYSPIHQPASHGSSPLAAAKPLRERNKPASAKRLIPDQPDAKVTLADGNNSAEVATVISSSLSVSASSIITSQDQGMVTVTAVGNMPATTLTGVRVVVGAGGDAGEFRVPTAPAPRPVQAQQASFNAQLTKLLPRYNNRPGRRVWRKNVVVQRQLPLLAKCGLQRPGIIAMKVLPHVSQKNELDGDGIKGYVPISNALATPGSQVIASPQIVTANILAPPTNLQASLPAKNDNLVTNEAIQTNILLPNQHAVLPQEVQPSMPVISTNPLTANAISVNVSGQPLLTVEMPVPVTAPCDGIGSSNNNSVPVITNPAPVTNVTDLLKPISFSSNSQIINETNSPIKNDGSGLDIINPLTPRKIDHLINSTVTVSQNFNILYCEQNRQPSMTTQVSATPSSTSLSSIVSEALSDFPDLSTPPGTPQPFCSTKSSSVNTSFLSHLENITSSTSTTIAYPCIPSPSLFNSSLSLDSLPSLNNGLMINTPLVSVLPSSTSSFSQLSDTPSQSLSPTPSITSLISSSTPLLSLGPPLLTTTTTSHLELSPPPMQTTTFSSILNTPTPHSSSGNNPTSSTHNISPPSTPLSVLLHSPPSGISKGFSSLLDSPPRSGSSNVIGVPELHIPEGSMNLPLLDISIGGTVTLADHASGILNGGPVTTVGSELPINSTIKSSSSSPLRSSTPTSSMMIEHRMQDNSSDKLLDITLGISNSNSSFSSLLASATQTPRVLDSSILGALNMDNLDCGVESGNQEVGSNILEGISGVGVSGFPALDTSTPSPPSSPCRLLQQGDNQWLNNEVNDFSLSSLLGHFESPVKGSSSSRCTSQSIPESLMPSLVAVYNENSVDFTAKFAEMKAKASQVYKN